MPRKRVSELWCIRADGVIREGAEDGEVTVMSKGGSSVTLKASDFTPELEKNLLGVIGSIELLRLEMSKISIDNKIKEVKDGNSIQAKETR